MRICIRKLEHAYRRLAYWARIVRELENQRPIRKKKPRRRREAGHDN